MFGDKVILKFLSLYFILFLIAGFPITTVIVALISVISFFGFFKQFKIEKKE